MSRLINGSGILDLHLTNAFNFTQVFLACNELNFINILGLIPDDCKLNISELGGKDRNHSYIEHRKSSDLSDDIFCYPTINPSEPLKIIQMNVCVRELRNYMQYFTSLKVTMYEFTTHDEEYTIKSVGSNGILITIRDDINNLIALLENKIPVMSSLLADALENEGNYTIYSDLRKIIIVQDVVDGVEFYQNLRDFGMTYFVRQ